MSNLPPLRDIIEEFGLGARKSLGQHFLLDINLTRRIASVAENLENRTVIEIGPGPGGLTRALVESKAKQIIAIEHDGRFIEALQSLVDVADGRLILLHADALKANYADLCQGPTKVIANLPYNISTPLMILWLKQALLFESLTLMFQKEVVDRLIAKPNTKQYGRLSVMTQWLCKVEKQFDVNPKAFVPPPKVQSSVVVLTPYKELPHLARFEDMEKVTQTAFNQRRKMLRASLKPLFQNTETVLNKAGIDPTQRAENLTIEDFARLANLITAPPAGL